MSSSRDVAGRDQRLPPRAYPASEISIESSGHVSPPIAATVTEMVLPGVGNQFGSTEEDVLNDGANATTLSGFAKWHIVASHRGLEA